MWFRHRKAQISGIDALIALSVFILVFSLFLTASDYLQVKKVPLFNEAYARAQRIAFTLTENTGEPSNWTSTIFTKIGLTSGERLVISETKMLNLVSANSSLVSDALGVGEYELRIRLLNTSGEVLRYGGSSTRIAYTTAGHDPSEGDESKFGIRSWMESNSIAFTNYNQSGSKTDFFNLLGNRSLYDTIILEDAHVDDQDLNATQQSDFRSWVSGGRVLFNKEHGEVIELLNVTTGGQSDGIVTAAGAASSFLNGLAAGDAVVCRNSASVTQVSGFDITELVADAGTPTIAQVARWNYGSGRVYHVCDTEGSVSGSVSLSNLRAAYNLFDVFGRLLELGSAPVNATVVAPARRIATYGNRTAILEVTLWRD